MDSSIVTFDAKPYPFSFPLKHTALLVIDMQRDFLLPKGFGDIQGGDLTAVQASIEPTRQLLSICRGAGLEIFHTREGHVPDLADLPSSKINRQPSQPGNKQYSMVIGDKGEMGRILVRGEYGHDIIDELAPLPGEVVIDKPGKGAFWNTRLMEKLQAKAITHILISGVTTECCFATSLREANDRGFECCGITEATAGFNEDFKTSSLAMIHWSQGLFGFVGDLQPLVDALAPYQAPSTAILAGTPPQTPPVWDGDLQIDSLATSYRVGVSPVSVVEAVYNKIEAYHATDPAVWITLESRENVLAAANELLQKYPDPAKRPVLFGVPFSVKDSIDVKGIPTTTACPPLAFIPTKSAVVYEKCIAEGAIYFGKTNLDQLATGLNGTRSPYGTPHSVYNAKFISGGSSSGNAVSVGARLVSFSLATDTAGSGRVPAAFNGVVGYKPTRGTVSFNGVTPACLSLDCCSFMAQTVADARKVWEVCEGYDAEDRYAKDTPPSLRHVNSIGPQAGKFNFGIPPPEALAICSPTYRKLFYQAVEKLQSIGGSLVEIDWSPFENGGQLLYEGTFVCERLASLPDGWLEENRANLHPVILQIFENVVNRSSSAVEAYRDLQKKALYTRRASRIFTEGANRITTLLVPTTPTHFTIEEILADPIARNSTLGYFTHSGNVLDLTGVAVPAAEYDASEMLEGAEGKLPFGVTFLGGSRTDSEVLEIARRFTAAVGL